MRRLLPLLGLLALACAAPRERAFTRHPTLGPVPGRWEGTRRDAADGSVAPLALVVRPLLGGEAFLEELEVRGEPVYRGVHVLLLDRERDRWIRHYANGRSGSFTALEGPARDGAEPGRTVWRNTSPGRTRESRLIEEVVPGVPGSWRRTQEVSADSASWNVLFVDELHPVATPR